MDTLNDLERLEQARQLIDDGKAKAALKILNALYKADEDNRDVIDAVVDALEAAELWSKARTVLLRALSRQPQVPELWIRLAYVFLAEDDQSSSAQAIEKALVANPNHPQLMLERARLAAGRGEREVMHQTLDAAMAAQPDNRVALLIERAGLYQSLALTPSEDEAQIKDALGMSCAVVPMQSALRDLAAAIALDPDSWRLHVKRAEVHKRLQEFDAAIEDYDRALACLDEEGESMRAFIEQEREGCGNGGRNEREALANSMREAMKSADGGELNFDDHLANNLVDALAGQYAEGNDMLGLLEEVSDDPNEALALSMAQDILKNAREPFADYQPVAQSDFSAAARAYCAKAEKALSGRGFVTLGDFEPVGLRQVIGKRALVRLFLSQDRQVCAAAYRYTPLKPGFWVWLILVVLRQWRHHHIVELESATRDGRFLVTNNTGKLNPFIDSGASIDILALPPGTGFESLIDAHLARMSAAGGDWADYQDTDGVLAYQEQLRLSKNAYRESIGFVSDAELHTMLGKQYDKFAPKIKKYLQLLTRANASSTSN